MQTAANHRQVVTTSKRQTGRRLCQNPPTGGMLRHRECRLDWLVEERETMLETLFLRQRGSSTCAELIACHSVGQR